MEPEGFWIFYSDRTPKFVHFFVMMPKSELEATATYTNIFLYYKLWISAVNVLGPSAVSVVFKNIITAWLLLQVWSETDLLF
jgi:hypothetical protein